MGSSRLHLRLSACLDFLKLSSLGTSPITREQSTVLVDWCPDSKTDPGEELSGLRDRKIFIDIKHTTINCRRVLRILEKLHVTIIISGLQQKS